jgi:hypothetical protein
MDIASLLKIRGSEINSGYWRADDAGRRAIRPALIEDAMEAGCEHLPAPPLRAAGQHYFNMRKTTIYGGSNEVQRNIVSQVVRLTATRDKEKHHGFRFHRRPGTTA